MRIENLRTERLAAPRGIVVENPEFTWTLCSDRENEWQTSCEVEVDRIETNGETTAVWRSGKLPRRIGEEVCYAGIALASRCEYRWRARVWDRDGQMGDWSRWAAFETGVLAPDRIGADWVCGGGALRREFPVLPGLQRARAYVSGLGYYEFFCNGGKISAAALAPSFTEFDLRVEYEIIDLARHLKPGANTVGFLLSDGWWRHGAETQRTRINQGLAEIVLEYADGRREVLGTDESWQAGPGPLPVAENTSPHQLFDGVALDLSWLASAWCVPGADPLGWQSARKAGNGVGELVPTLLPPVREVETLRPCAVRRLSDHLLSVEFSQNFTGWVRFQATASRGARFTVRYAELLQPDGRLNPATLRSAKQTDAFLLAGTPSEKIEPRFVYHGFKQVEIEGPVGAIDIDSIQGVVVHTDLEPIGEIATSDNRINWLLGSVRWTVRSNAMSVMTDVCQRDERRGWLMDGVTALKAGLLFYNMDGLARKWIDDMIDNQEPDGSLRSDSAPAWFPCKSVGWQRAIVLLPLALYEVDSDRAVLRRAFPHMCRYVDFLLANRKEGLLPKGFSHHPGEWLCIGKRNDQVSDNAMAIDVLRKVAQAAEVLGGPEGRYYSGAADEMALAARKQWPPGNSGSFGGNGGEGYAQANQVYALRFGLVSSEHRKSVFDSLVDDLMNARGEGPFVTTGIGSTEHLPIVLSEFGRDDLVWRWLQRDSYPGYGFMQRHGATAIWECWELRTDRGMNAHNHTGLSGIGVWLKEYLVGIRSEAGPEPVFHLRPAVHLPLATLSAVWQSRWGEIRIRWETEAGRKSLTVSIPPGCRGRLYLPGDFTGGESAANAGIELTSGTAQFII